MIGMPTVTCPDCRRTFTDPNYKSRANAQLTRHLNKRENLCTSTERTAKRVATFNVPNIEELNISGIVNAIKPETSNNDVITTIFKHLYKLNRFVVWPNTKLQEVIYKSKGEAVYAKPPQFFTKFWHVVIQDQVRPILKEKWPRYEEFNNYIQTRTTWKFLEWDVWRQSMLNAFYQSELFTDMEQGIITCLKSVSRGERCQLKASMGTLNYNFQENTYEVFEGRHPWRCLGDEPTEDERFFEKNEYQKCVVPMTDPWDV